MAELESAIEQRLIAQLCSKEIEEYAMKWYVDAEDVRYEVYHYRDGVPAYENNLKEKADYTAYKGNAPGLMPKFKC